MYQKTMINGISVPYELETAELLNLLESKDMSSFSIACEALSYKEEDGAYQALVPFLKSRDRYRRLCVFKSIYRHPQAAELSQYLAEQLRSEDVLFVRAALHNIADYQTACPEEEVKKAVLLNRKSLCDEFKVLRFLEPNDDNYSYLRLLLSSVDQSIAQEIIAEILIEQYSLTKGEELVQLLSASTNSKLRLQAVCLGKKLGMDMTCLSKDPDGHVRRAVQQWTVIESQINKQKHS